MRQLILGAPAPAFTAASPVNPKFAFSSVGGRYILLAFLPPPGDERDTALKLIREAESVFQDDHCIFLGVLPDAESYATAHNAPPVRWLADQDGDVRQQFGLTETDGSLIPTWVLIDPSLRILAFAPLRSGPAIIAKVRSLAAPDDHAGTPIHAPVLIVPRIFEPAFCRRLIDLYLVTGGAPSGVMQVRDGKTIGVLNEMKRRRDAPVEDEELKLSIRNMLITRLLPEIGKAFQYRPTRIERYIVACYDAHSGGYFRPHRDNTTPGTAHRRFAVSINLNDDFDGGDLRFPEFGNRTYRPPLGGAIVFSCSLLHEATSVIRGIVTRPCHFCTMTLQRRFVAPTGTRLSDIANRGIASARAVMTPA